MWRLLSSDLTGTLQSASHTGEVGKQNNSMSVGWLCPGVRGVVKNAKSFPMQVTDISFGRRSDVVCTVSDAGEVRCGEYHRVCRHKDIQKMECQLHKTK